MNFYLIGIDYKSAPVEIREAIFKERKDISAYWANFSSQTVILSTCNRFEIYLVSANQADILKRINLFKSRFPQFSKYSYIKISRKEIFLHALRLATGLESQLKGELQILGQLERWIAQDQFPTNLKALWQEAIALARDIRFESGFNNSENNLAGLILEDLAKSSRIQGKIDIIVIGTGKISQLFASTQHSRFNFSFVAHKNQIRARQLAKQAGGKYISFQELPQALENAQVLISATTSPHFILRKEDIPSQIFKGDKSFLIYDLALPRDIDPEIGKIRNIVLYNLDDLSSIFQKHSNRIQEQINRAEFLTLEAKNRFQEIANEHDLKSRFTQLAFSLKAG